MSTHPNDTQPADELAPRRDQAALDYDVAAYLDLTEQAEDIKTQLDAIKARLAERGAGKYEATGGVTVSVTTPPRRFNPDRAWSMLTTEQQALCVSPDPAKVKKQLSQVLVDECMDEGTGAPRVSIK